MFPQFASTAASLTRATALMSRVGTDAYLYDEPEDGNIAMLLESKFEAEKAEGMKRLIALLSQGRDVSNFFPQVVKNVATTSLEVKKLVYIYLVHYAEKRPDEALLSINSFQKDLSDLNPLIRAWSLRAMSGIRVRVVVPLVVMAVTKCSRDPSPYVRRCSAHALPKIFALDREAHAEVLEELVCLLLSDRSPGVVGAAAAAFLVVCPDRLSLLGPRFRKLCEMLPDVDEWGQVVLLDILMRYAVARYEAPRDSVVYSSSLGKANSEVKLQEGLAIEKHESVGKETAGESELPADVQGLLQCTTPMLRSQNSAVVMAVAGVHWLFAPRKDVRKIVKPLLFLLRSSYDSQYVILANIATFASAMPSLFENHYEEFFVRFSDSAPLRALKLDILTTIATESSIHAILQEFQAYVRDTNRQFAADTVSAIGRCAVRLPAVGSACVEGLLMLAKGALVGSESKDEVNGKEETRGLLAQGSLKISAKEKGSREAGVVAQAVLALRSIVQQHPVQQEEVFARLIRLLDQMRVPEARAVVIWMVGEHSLNSPRIIRMLPVVLRYLAGSFIKEADETKLQIMNCAAKVVLRSEGDMDSPLAKTATLVLEHSLSLGSQDMSTDIRDRARLLRQLLASPSRPLLTVNPQEPSLILTKRLHSLELDESEPHSTTPQKLQGTVDVNGYIPSDGNKDQNAELNTNLAKQILLVPKSPPVLPSLAPDRSSFIPGSMSHIVNHKAPGYMPLPEPHTLEAPELATDENLRNSARNQEDSTEHTKSGQLSGDYSDSGSDRASTGIRSDTSGSYSGQEGGSESEENISDEEGSSWRKLSQRSSQPQSQKESSLAPLISLDDETPGFNGIDGGGEFSNGLPLKSGRNLESWLDSPDTEQRSITGGGVSPSSASSATLSLGPITPHFKKMTLLDFTNGEGLDVKYSFARIPSMHSQRMVCVRLYLHNRSAEPISEITVRAAEESKSSDNLGQATGESQTVVPIDEVSELGPGSTTESNLYVDFRHQLTPVQLAILVHEKLFSVKLSPEVGALLRPLQLTAEAFATTESRISGMHQSSRRCFVGSSCSDPSSSTGEDKVLVLSRAVATRVLSVAHVALVSAILPISDLAGLTGLRLCFGGETLTGPLTCLISVTFVSKDEGETRDNTPILIKVNCEDTIFGLNLLKQLDETLSS